MERIYQVGKQLADQLQIAEATLDPREWSHPPTRFVLVAQAGESSREKLEALQAKAEKRRLTKKELATLPELRETVRKCLPRGVDHHGRVCKLVNEWMREFASYETRLVRIPDGWTEMAEMFGELRQYHADPFLPIAEPGLDGELEELSAVLELRLASAKDLAGLWVPVWSKLSPWLRSGIGLSKTPVLIGNEWDRVAGLFVENEGDKNFAVPFEKINSDNGDTQAIKRSVNKSLVKLGSRIRVKVKAGALRRDAKSK